MVKSSPRSQEKKMNAVANRNANPTNQKGLNGISYGKNGVNLTQDQLDSILNAIKNNELNLSTG